MRRIIGTVSDILILGAVVLGIIALWGLLPTESREEVPATVRVAQGRASVLRPAAQSERTVDGLASLDTGGRLRVPAGGDVFLLYANGSISRVTGPAEVVLEESTRTAKKPALLTRILTMIRGATPPPPDEVNVIVRVKVLRGEVVTKAAAPSSTGSVFQMKTLTSHISAGNASFILKVSENGETSLEVGQGPVTVGMVGVTEGGVVPVAIPELASRRGVLIPALPGDKATSTDARDTLSRLDAAMPGLRGVSGTVNLEGMEFSEARAADITYFVGRRTDDPRPSAFTPRVSQTQSAAGIEDKVRIPGSQTFTLTDQDIAGNLPAPFAANTRVHVLAGSAVRIETGDLTVVATLSAVDGRLDIRGLPFDVNPSQVSQAIADRIGGRGQEVPPLLSVSSEPGRLTVTYVTDMVAPRPGVSGGPDVETPPSLPRTTEYFKTIPTPREVSTDWKVVGSNAFLAGIITYLISMFSGFASSFVKERESRLGAQVSRVHQIVRKVTGWRGLRGRVASWVATARLTRAVLTMFLFGALYSFLSSGSGLFGPGGLVVFLTLSLTTGFFALYEPWIRSFAARRMKIAARVALYPGQIVVALSSVAISRLVAFTPGLMLGGPGGLAMPEEGPTPNQKLKLAIVSLASFAILGGGAWGVAYVLPFVAQQPWAQAIFRTAQGLTSWVQDWCLAAFAMAVQRILFGLLPLPSSTGRDILKRNLIVWTIPFALILLLFIHTQVNKQRTVLELTPQVYVTLGAVLVLGGAAQVYTRLKKRRVASRPKT